MCTSGGFSATIAEPLRRILWRRGDPADPTTRTSAIDAEAALAQPPLAARIDAERIRHAVRLTRSAPASLYALVQAPGAKPWRDELVHALGAMQMILAPRLDDLPDPATALQQWETSWRAAPAQWLALVRLFLRTARAWPRW